MMKMNSSGTKPAAGRQGLAALAAAVILFLASPAAAEVETFDIDPVHSAVGFKIKHLFSRVPGEFEEFEGTIKLDRDDWSKSSVNVKIKTASINTNEDPRDKHLRSDDFFAAEKFPEITFVSDGVRKKGKDKLTVRGNLTMRGVTKQVLLDVDVLGFADYYGAERAGFEATTRVNRQDFGVSWNDTLDSGGFVLGDEVAITLNIQAKKRKAEKASK